MRNPHSYFGEFVAASVLCLMLIACLWCANETNLDLAVENEILRAEMTSILIEHSTDYDFERGDYR